MTDWNNDYTHAGPGRKRRERLALAMSAKPTPDPRPKNRIVKNPKRTEEDISARDVKERIRRLVLDHGMSHADICATLKQDGHSITPITVSAIRSQMLEVLRMLMRDDIGLIDPDTLARYRRKRSR